MCAVRERVTVGGGGVQSGGGWQWVCAIRGRVTVCAVRGRVTGGGWQWVCAVRGRVTVGVCSQGAGDSGCVQSGGG